MQPKLTLPAKSGRRSGSVKCATTSPPPAQALGMLLQAIKGACAKGMGARGVTIRRTNYMLHMELSGACTARRYAGETVANCPRGQECAALGGAAERYASSQEKHLRTRGVRGCKVSFPLKTAHSKKG